LSDPWQRLAGLRAELAGACATSPDRRVGRLLDELGVLLREAQEHDRAQEGLLREVTLVLSCIKPGRVLQLIMDSVIRLSGAQRGFLLLRRDDGSHEVAAARRMERVDVETPETELSRKVVQTVLETRRPLRLEDALNTPPYSLAESVTRLKILSVLCVPILADDRLLGVVYLENRRASGVFSAATEALLADFALKIAPAILNAEAMEHLRAERERWQAAFAREYRFEGVVGHSLALREALRLVAVAAPSDLPILVEGESGTGKELIARAVHLRSPRAERPFVSVNCAALPGTLLESELFGHRRGAFTGAVQERRGLFASAHRGTLFLDEIGEMPLELQAKLLRVLQSGEYRPVGSDSLQRADVRIVAATVRRLEAEVKAQRFRRDLFFRLKGVHVVLPPLRERREDIPLLIERFLEKFSPADRPTRIDDAARACLVAYDYPGNVRELETIVRRAILFAREGVIGVDALPPEVTDPERRVFRLPPRVPCTASELLAAKRLAADRAAREIERAFLLHALSAAEGRPGEAARRVGMNRSQFSRMLGRHGLTTARRRTAADRST